MVKYSLIKQIGGGPRGVVYKSTLEGYDGYVAIKKVLRDRSCESLYSMVRELVAFKRMDHEHILKMISAWTESATISLALEYMPYDLTALLLSGYKMCDKQIASIAYQIIDAVSYMHTLGIIHRDIKPSNILIDQAGRIKVSDFGMSRDYAPRMSPGVCSLWYRAPELLLGDNEYDDKIDSWSVGCVIVELKTGRPFFNSRSEITQVEEIFKMLGCPEDRYPWSEFISFERYRKEGPWEDVIDLVLGEYFDTPMRKVLAGLLRLDKGKRISLSEAKKMPGILAGKDRFFSVVHKECHEYDVSADYYK